jgi:hypothetical protein
MTAAQGSPERLNREQLIEAVDILIHGGTSSEAEDDALLTRVLRSVPHAQTMGKLMYHPPRPTTAEEIVNEALAYKPIAL